MSQQSTPSLKKTGAVIEDWQPENAIFWQQHGRRIAQRNLWISIPCLLLSFCVWMLFSAVAVNLN
ncbi:MAG: nitrate/nitrite transporter, partial [Gibbsiella quercinecans]